MTSIDQQVQAAQAAANAGRWQEAERLWRAVRAADPNHPKALFSLGVHAYQRGALAEAAEHLALAEAAAPADPQVPFMHAVVRRDAGDADGEWAALHRALAIDAYFLPALLAKGALQERIGQPKVAAVTYRNCLKIAPPPPRWPQHLRPQLEHAARLVQADIEAYHAFLESQLGPLRAARGVEDAKWREATSIMSGRTRPYLSDSNQLYVPRLPALTFYDRSHFPWAAGLEAQTDAIREELEAALAQERADFAPYIAYRPGDPVNQWKELNHSDRWSTYSLWKAGEPDAAHLARCPKTAAALEEVDQADIGGLCPNAMFSALAPHTEIPPHHGETNARLVAHLPLIVPEGCVFRCGFDERPWRVGESFAFDDTLEHAAYNRSDELRVVLIFDVWNPLLSAGERDLVRAMAAAARAWQAG